MKKIAIGLGIWLTLGAYTTYVRHPASEVKDGSAGPPSEERMEHDWAPLGEQMCIKFNQLDGTLEERVELILALPSARGQDPVVKDFIRRHLVACPPK